MASRKLGIAVLFGGRSGEHEVSLASARSIMQAMDKSKYDIYPIGIDKVGRWLTSGDPMALLSSGSTSPTTDALTLSENSRELVPGISRARFPDVDVVFPVLHGTFGEDGTVQGLLELADLPYVGSGVLGSSLGLDKVAMKGVLSAHSLPVVEYLPLLARRWRQDADGVIEEVEARFHYPVFVKPANLGSSVGVTKAHNRQELCQGLDLAARYDRKLLVERAVNAREIECSVLGNDEPIASVLGEVVPCNEFYDYRAKYIDDASELLIPAPLSEEVAQRVRDLAVRTFQALDSAGLARVDFFVCRDNGEIYINELNTMPGFTSISMYPKLWEASGIPYPELIDRLIALALERHREKQSLERSYDVH
jgi:D-alanine-D-alanine ligase